MWKWLKYSTAPYLLIALRYKKSEIWQMRQDCSYNDSLNLLHLTFCALQSVVWPLKSHSQLHYLFLMARWTQPVPRTKIHTQHEAICLWKHGAVQRVRWPHVIFYHRHAKSEMANFALIIIILYWTKRSWKCWHTALNTLIHSVF